MLSFLGFGLVTVKLISKH